MDGETSDEEIGQRITEALEEDRGHNDYWKYAPNEDVEEAGIVREFFRASGLADEGYGKVVPRGENDPPDCEAVNSEADTIGVEVTELIDQSVLEENVKRNSSSGLVEAEWNQEKFARKLRERVKEKDGADLEGGPYAEYFLIVHTDEGNLEHGKVRSWVEDMEFESPELLTRGFVIISYDAGRRHCPYVELQL